MDEMLIKSKFMTNVVSKLVKKALKKKTGHNVDIQLNNLCTYTTPEEKMHIHLDVDAELTREELANILKSIGLD